MTSSGGTVSVRRRADLQETVGFSEESHYLFAIRVFTSANDRRPEEGMWRCAAMSLGVRKRLDGRV
jgi:hypothetical protein